MMCKLISIRTLTSVSFVAAAAFSILSFSPPAATAASLSSCRGPTAKQVIDCCEKVVRVQKPYWMMDSGSSCGSAVVCSGGGKKYGNTPGIKVMMKIKKLCYIQPVLKDLETKSPPQKSGRNPNGGP
jgi:hypothetical protein